MPHSFDVVFDDAYARYPASVASDEMSQDLALFRFMHVMWY